MSNKRASDPWLPYFVTFTLVKWLPLFKENHYSEIIVQSLKHCVDNKGLEVFAYCIMPTHIHLIIRAADYGVGNIMRDIKKFTSFEIVKTIEKDNMIKCWIDIFMEEAKLTRRNKIYKVWQEGSYPKPILTNKFFFQKLNYIHMNPVKAGLVLNSWDYYYSSARNYAELNSPLDIILQSRELKFF